MWIYQKKLEFPVNITTPDLRVARALMAQYGGPDSELAAGCRYLTQRFSMPDDRVRATLNDIGTEEFLQGLADRSSYYHTACESVCFTGAEKR